MLIRDNNLCKKNKPEAQRIYSVELTLIYVLTIRFFIRFIIRLFSFGKLLLSNPRLLPANVDGCARGGWLWRWPGGFSLRRWLPPRRRESGH